MGKTKYYKVEVYENDFPTRNQIRIAVDFREIMCDDGNAIRRVRSKRRDIPAVDERQYVAEELRNMGYSYPLIAWALDRDHTSIMHLINKRGKTNGTQQTQG